MAVANVPATSVAHEDRTATSRANAATSRANAATSSTRANGAASSLIRNNSSALEVGVDTALRASFVLYATAYGLRYAANFLERFTARTKGAARG